jgi:hypothetical protein
MILWKKGNSAYEINLPKTWKGHQVFNEARIKKFRKPEFLQQSQTGSRPDPIITNEGREEYEVHDILDERKNNGKTEYLIRWKDYGPEDDTWELRENLWNTQEILWHYESRGWASEKVGYHVMNRVTEATLDRPTGEPNQPGLIHLPPGLRLETTQPSVMELNNETPEQTNNLRTTIKGHSNWSPSNDLASGLILMGKLCRRALALIKHKVGVDGSVSDHMAQALATWLWQWGITINTETEL